jgi:hypothetical protein
MDPQVAAVYDEVISLRLKKQIDPELRSLFVSTKIPTSKDARLSQAKTYANWCGWCVKNASNLNAKNVRWVDWNAAEPTGVQWTWKGHSLRLAVKPARRSASSIHRSADPSNLALFHENLASTKI